MIIFFPNNGEDEYSKKRAKHAGKSLTMNLTRAKEDQHQSKEWQMCQKNHDLNVCFNTFASDNKNTEQ